jgi:hypothetical protein
MLTRDRESPMRQVLRRFVGSGWGLHRYPVLLLHLTGIVVGTSTAMPRISRPRTTLPVRISISPTHQQRSAAFFTDRVTGYRRYGQREEINARRGLRASSSSAPVVASRC